jgi:hypothetical protein
MTDAAVAEKDLSHNPGLIGLAWVAVGLPLLWGVLQTLVKAAALFR